MCPSPSASSGIEAAPLTLEIKAADESTEIFVVDGDLQLVDRGVGRLVTKPLPPGIYKVKSRAGSETREEHVVLRGPGQKIELTPFSFVSPAPLRDTSATHEYHMDASETQSKKVHVTAGAGSWLFVFAREFTRGTNQPATARLLNPAVGLSICTPAGDEVANIEHQAVVDSSVPDAWAACNVELNPGVHVLRTQFADRGRFEQAIVTSPGWQTQVFVLPRSSPAGRGPDVANAAILMSRGKGFFFGDARLRQAELARLGLANRRKVVSEDVRRMLRDKCEDPMLGIFAAHLVLLDAAPALHGRNGEVMVEAHEPDMGLVQTVVQKLRYLLTDPHPDVEALGLAAGLGTPYVFDSPPMLRRSWNLVLNATIQKPALVPPDSLAARAGRASWSDQPWLVWSADTLPEADAVEAAFEMQMAAPPTATGAASQPSDSPFAAIRRKRAAFASTVQNARTAMPPTIQEAMNTLESATSAVADVAEKQITMLVKTLGMPRSSVERMLSTRKKRSSNAQHSDE